MHNKHAPRMTTRVQMGEVRQCEARNLRELEARLRAGSVVVETENEIAWA